MGKFYVLKDLQEIFEGTNLVFNTETVLKHFLQILQNLQFVTVKTDWLK